MNAPALFTLTPTPGGVAMDTIHPHTRGVINACRNAARIFRGTALTTRERAGYLQGVLNMMNRAGTVAELHGQVLELRTLDDPYRAADTLDRIADAVHRNA